MSQARIQGGGGGKGALPLPPIFWGKNKGAKNHTHRKKEIKIGQPRSKIQAKNSCEVGGGGLRGNKGKYLVHKVILK